MKFFVWEWVLEGYQAGIVCIVAPDIETAWQLLEEDCPGAYRNIRKGDTEFHQPREVKEPEVFIRWGCD